MTAREEARARAIAWAREVAADPNAVFLDTETTGLGDDAEICDIGIVGIDGRVILDCLVKPSRAIPAGATAVHGISNAMVATAREWGRTYVPFINALQAASRVVVYNRDYDLGIIARLCASLELPLPVPTPKWECAMLAFSDYRGVPGKFPGSFKWFRLDDAAAHFGIPPGGHRAMSDAETARRVVLAISEG